MSTSFNPNCRNYSRNKDRDRYRVEVAIRKLGRNLNSGDRIPLTKAELKRYDPTPDDEEGDSNEEASDPEDSDHNQDFDQGSQSVGDAGSRNSSKCDSVKVRYVHISILVVARFILLA